MSLKKSANKKKKKSKKLKYVAMERSDALDAYVRKQCDSLLRRVSARPQKYRLKFRVRPEAKNAEAKVTSFQVDGAVVITGRKSLRASAKGANAKKAIDEVIDALEKKVRRDSEKRERSRKTLGRSMKPIREYQWELSLDSR